MGLIIDYSPLPKVTKEVNNLLAITKIKGEIYIYRNNRYGKKVEDIYPRCLAEIGGTRIYTKNNIVDLKNHD